MIETVRQYIHEQQLLSHTHLYVVGLSGGADSVALLRLLLLMGYRIEAAHCNFHLRGEESSRDEAFVSQLCQQLSVPLHLAHFDTSSYAGLHKTSIEMAARELRYHYFSQLCRDLHAEGVCVAHHQDDNAETLLMNIIRGTGIHGLTGMKPLRLFDDALTPSSDGSKDRLTVIRPLLCVNRLQIERWLYSLQQPYVTDSSNLKSDVTRNKIRLELMPKLKELNPRFVDDLLLTARRMRETEQIYQHYMDAALREKIQDNTLSVVDLKASKAPLSLLYEWLQPAGFSPATILQISQRLDAPAGRIWQSSTHEVCIDRQRLLLSRLKPSFTPIRLPELGTYLCADGMKISLTLTPVVAVERSPLVACLDADKVRFPLTLRTAARSDRFIPYGMKGSKLVSDFLTDLKVPLTAKRRQLVLTDADGQLLWIVSRRIAAPFAITPTTRRMLKISTS